MESQQQRIKQFMEFAGQSCPDKPTQLDEQTAKLRAVLILEEAFETITKGLGLIISIAQSSGTPTINWEEVEITARNLKHDSLSIEFIKEKEVDLVELADGISDISVVSYGAALAAGIDMEPIDKEVSDSNLSKGWKLEELNTRPEGSTVSGPIDNLYVVKRSDGKMLKSPSYKPANIRNIIEK
jgi:predicted HAD superfamily Cof-like phosphohydrolase